MYDVSHLVEVVLRTTLCHNYGSARVYNDFSLRTEEESKSRWEAKPCPFIFHLLHAVLYVRCDWIIQHIIHLASFNLPLALIAQMGDEVGKQGFAPLRKFNFIDIKNESWLTLITVVYPHWVKHCGIRGIQIVRHVDERTHFMDLASEEAEYTGSRLSVYSHMLNMLDEPTLERLRDRPDFWSAVKKEPDPFELGRRVWALSVTEVDAVKICRRFAENLGKMVVRKQATNELTHNYTSSMAKILRDFTAFHPLMREAEGELQAQPAQALPAGANTTTTTTTSVAKTEAASFYATVNEIFSVFTLTNAQPSVNSAAISELQTMGHSNNRLPEQYRTFENMRQFLNNRAVVTSDKQSQRDSANGVMDKRSGKNGNRRGKPGDNDGNNGGNNGGSNGGNRNEKRIGNVKGNPGGSNKRQRRSGGNEGKGSGCHECGDLGHYVKDCPIKNGNGGTKQQSDKAKKSSNNNNMALVALHESSAPSVSDDY